MPNIIFDSNEMHTLNNHLPSILRYISSISRAEVFLYGIYQTEYYNIFNSLSHDFVSKFYWHTPAKCPLYLETKTNTTRKLDTTLVTVELHFKFKQHVNICVHTTETVICKRFIFILRVKALNFSCNLISFRLYCSSFRIIFDAVFFIQYS